MSNTKPSFNARHVLVNLRYGTVHALDFTFDNRPNADAGQHETGPECGVRAEAHRRRVCGR